MAKITYVGIFRFPDGDPAAARVLGIGKALRAAGHTVSFIGAEHQGREADRASDGTYRYQGFDYYTARPVAPTLPSRLGHLWRTLITGSTVLARLARLPDGSPDVVIAYHPSSILLLRLQAWCRSHGAVLIADCTEWHSAARISGGRYGFFRWDNDVRMGWLHTRVGRLITISRWLAAHYAQQGCTTLCVPPLVDLDDAKCQVKRPAVATPERPLHLVFSGSPDRERLDLIMEGLHLLRADGHQVAISFVGSTRESAVRILGDRAALLDGLDTCLTFHGRVPVEHVQALLAEADFGLLFRYRERATEACFPTKVPEFLALGVPLICNVTTDVGVYLKDGASALFIPEDSATAFAATVARACALAPEVHQAMRAAASRCAATCFDYRAYAAMLHAFVNAQIAPTGTAVPPSGVPLP